MDSCETGKQHNFSFRVNRVAVAEKDIERTMWTAGEANASELEK